MQKNLNYKNKLGAIGEQMAIDYLQKQGFDLVTQNFHSKYGEIDVLMRRKDLLVVVEVKSRKQEYFPVSSVVTLSKQQKIIKTFKVFLQKFSETYSSQKFAVRFDVVVVLVKSGSIEHFQNAFFGS